MKLSDLTIDQIPDLDNETLADIRDRANRDATIIENRNVISDSAHRAASHFRNIESVAKLEITVRSITASAADLDDAWADIPSVNRVTGENLKVEK